MCFAQNCASIMQSTLRVSDVAKDWLVDCMETEEELKLKLELLLDKSAIFVNLEKKLAAKKLDIAALWETSVWLNALLDSMAPSYVDLQTELDSLWSVHVDTRVSPNIL